MLRGKYKLSCNALKVLVTVAKLKNNYFGTVSGDDDGGPYFDSGPKAWHYFLIIGLPILLALIGVIGTAGILYWAIRKGYIRHVPKSYNSFSNSAGTVQYDSNRDAVHI